MTGASQPGICTEKSDQFMKKQIKAIPEFANEQEERLFWEEHDSSEFVDWNSAPGIQICAGFMEKGFCSP
jgi:hypothetical protein